MNHLIIGNQKYSSWSLRPWLVMKEFKIDFTEIKIYLYKSESKEKILKYSPSGKVPALIHSEHQKDDLVIWDSLAICEFLAEEHPTKYLWPEDRYLRAQARSVSHEMHSGFNAIRNDLPMNCNTSIVLKNISHDLQADIKRVCDIWQELRTKHSSKGPYLFGEFSICDAMFAPIALRFNSYGIKVGPLEQEYIKQILQMPSVKIWMAAGCEESEILEMCEIIE